MRPRLLLVPTLSPAEWPILAELETWADVAVAPGTWTRDGLAVEQALAALEERDWDKVVLAVDEWSVVKAAEVAALRPDILQGLALGHACLELTISGSRPTLNPEVVAGYSQLMRTDFRTWGRALTQTTAGAYDDAAIDAFLDATSHDEVLEMFERINALDGRSFEPELRAAGVPMLLGHHTECLLWTDEGFRDAVEAFPDARRVRTREKCSTSPDFARALREFCESL